MKTIRQFSTLGAAAGLASAFGAEVLPFEDDVGVDRNRVFIGARFSFNIQAELRNGAVAANVPPAYDDGFVRPDSSGASGSTWYWGYDRADQIVGDSLALSISTGSPRDGMVDTLQEDPQAGFELLYGRVLGRFGLGPATTITWGILGGFSSLDVLLEESDTINGTLSRTTDSYSLGGISPPPAPYAGTFAGPGPVIGSAAAASLTTTLPAWSATSAKVDALLLGFKLGPFVEVPIYRRLSAQLSGGLGAIYAQHELSFTETLGLTAAGGPPPARVGRFQDDAWLLGFFGQAQLEFRLGDTMSVFAGGQYRHLGDTSVAGGGKEATLDLAGTFEGIVGLKFSF
ncbi:MAG: hypothetical protein FJ387_04515 [Verrucomicrobia bacterium]|nr:hypothetical protein [Verrucomicrobiota bacterium]